VVCVESEATDSMEEDGVDERHEDPDGVREDIYLALKCAWSFVFESSS
jgi:hypothetical protein